MSPGHKVSPYCNTRAPSAHLFAFNKSWPPAIEDCPFFAATGARHTGYQNASL